MNKQEFQADCELRATTEPLKPAFYNTLSAVMIKAHFSNIEINKQFEKFVAHCAVIMTHPRIINQFNLALDKFQVEHGIVTSHFKQQVVTFIQRLPKNY